MIRFASVATGVPVLITLSFPLTKRLKHQLPLAPLLKSFGVKVFFLGIAPSCPMIVVSSSYDIRQDDATTLRNSLYRAIFGTIFGIADVLEGVQQLYQKL